MRAFAHHFAFEFRTGIRNKNLLLMNYLFPLGFYVLMGLIMPQINPFFAETMIPAMVVFAVLAATLMGLPDPLVKARETGIFRSYRINGIPAVSILLIPALTTILHLVIVAIIVTATAPLLFRSLLPVDWLGFILVFAAITCASAGASVLIGVISPSSRMTVFVSQLYFIPSMLLSGLMLPLSMLPKPARAISQLLPATHAMNAWSGLAMGKATDFSAWGSVIVLSLGAALAFLLSIYLFDWDRRNATRRGHPALAVLALVPYVIGIFVL